MMSTNDQHLERLRLVSRAMAKFITQPENRGLAPKDRERMRPRLASSFIASGRSHEMKTPDERMRRLVSRFGDALADYHGEEHGNLACFLQAASILIKAGLIRGFEPDDFLTVEEYKPRHLHIVQDNNDGEPEVPF
jgi:hypothetical protein